MWSIVGGSGFEKFEGFEVIRELDRSTPFGVCSSGLKLVRVSNTEAIFLPRHGSNHELLPSEVNYRANIYAIKRHGATKLISMSAVGSLKKDYKPGDLVIPFQFIDRTKSIRKHTFCGEGLVGHVSLAKPVSAPLSDIVLKLRETLGFNIHFNGTAVCIEGPCFSTQAESK